MKTSTLNWLSGILGLWLILVVFLGFSSTLNRVFFVATGLMVAILNFWSVSRAKPFFLPPPRDSEIRPDNNGNRQESGEKQTLSS